MVPDKPAAEILIDEPLIRRLLTAQATEVVPDAATLPLARAEEGWDCAVWRLGDELAVRLPRRALAAPLILHEQSALPSIATRVAPTGVRVPAPVFAGSPGEGFPWAWSVVPWIDGVSGIAVPRAERTGWAPSLALGLAALHAPAPADHPVNTYRGGPLAIRTDAVAERIAALRGTVPDLALDTAHRIWREGLAAHAWEGGPVWIHGDLHPGNLVARGAELTGMVDFGDVTAGDPAYDLAIAWLAFDAHGRGAFISETGTRYDSATWRRARAWAVAVSLMLLFHSDDNPAYAALGTESLDELTRS